MKNQYLLLVFVLFFISCGKTNKEKIIGTWEITSFDFFDKSIATEEMLNRIAEKNSGKIEYEGITRFMFNKDRSFKTFRGHKNIDEGHMEYRIIDENMHSYYPNYPEEKPNGNLISIIGFEDDGRLYDGGNMFGPFEIILLKENKLILKDVYAKFQWGEEYAATEHNNLLINFTRIDN